MDFFEKELRGMFEKHQLLKEQKYCGNVLLAKLDGELRVKLQLFQINGIWGTMKNSQFFIN